MLKGEESDQLSRVGLILVKLTLTGFFLKLDFTRKGTGGLKRRFRSLTQVGQVKDLCQPPTPLALSSY